MRRCLHRLLTATLSALTTVLLVAPVMAQSQAGSVEARQGMVVTVSPPASEVGVAVLKQGGNAVDAAVAVAFALSVTWPEAGNIGGGGFMLVHPGGSAAPVFIDYRETAPQAATREMFAIAQPHAGHKVVGVPGTVRGLALAHEKFGKLAWKDVLAPAVRLADEGFALDATLAGSLNRQVRTSGEFAELRRVMSKPGPPGPWNPGDRFIQKDLAGTLRHIADEGPKAFYEGAVAEQIVAEMKAGGGLIAKEDLSGYQAKLREPIRGAYRGFDIFTAPPPSGGGICLVEMLNILENFPLKQQGRTSPETMHVVIETMRRAYLDRARHLGDADFTKIPAELTSKEYAKQLADKIDLKHATPSADLAPEIKLADERPHTTHFSIIDRNGMAVANTYTLNDSYGSRVMVRGAGFLLNNEMTDFNPKPGVTDRNGTIGTDPNDIAPGKRMLSSMTPTIVMRDGHVMLITGSPGGRTITNTVLCILLDVLDFQMDLRAAVDAPRLHEQWMPDRVQFESVNQAEFKTTIAKLKEMGHVFSPSTWRQGDAHSIFVDPRGVFYGAADKRIAGKAAGY